MYGDLGKSIAVFAAALSIMLGAGELAVAATIDRNVSLPGIPQAGDPSFTFDSQASGSTIMGWYSNYIYIAPTDDGYEVQAYNSGSFEFEQAAGEVYEGTSGSLALNAQLDHDGNVVSGEYQLTGKIEDLGITSTEVLTSGDIVNMASDDSVIGLATDNISCASEINNCLDAESIYVFGNMNLPNLADLDGTAGFVATTASLTTVPIPGSVFLFTSGLALLFKRAHKVSARAS